MTAQTYQQASDRFITQAREELAAGDPQQAPEKGWGAAAQIIKAAAEERGWAHSRHRHYLQAIGRLRSETGDADIRRLFNSASALHENFYENTMEPYEVAEALEHVQALAAKIRALLTPGLQN